MYDTSAKPQTVFLGGLWEELWKLSQLWALQGCPENPDCNPDYNRIFSGITRIIIRIIIGIFRDNPDYNPDCSGISQKNIATAMLFGPTQEQSGL